VKWGAEARLNRGTTYFGISPNGEYDFGGGTVYSPVFIPSASGQHNVQVGDPLPDTLSTLLIGYPWMPVESSLRLPKFLVYTTR
jgi:hypothetical protein